MALETIFHEPAHYNNAAPHQNQTKEEENQYHYAPHGYAHEYAVYPEVHRTEHVYYDHPDHEEYDAYQHDKDTDYSTSVTYGHGGDQTFHTEFDETCGKKEFCSKFSRLLARDTHEFVGRPRA